MPRPPVTPYTGPFGGEARALGPVKAAQARLSAMDLSVPKYFLDRPELSTPEYNTPVPPVGR